MNVLWLSHLVPYPPKGGVLQRSYNLVRQVAQYHRVSILGFIQNELLKRMFGDLDTGIAVATSELGKFCEDVRFLPIPSEGRVLGREALAARSIFSADPYTINWLKSAEMEKQVTKWANDKTFDIVHFDTISLAPYKKLFPSQASVLNHHNIESSMMLRRAERERNPLRKLYFSQEGKRLQRYERVVSAQMDANVTCSLLDKARLQQIAPSARIEEIPNGVDENYFTPGSKDEEQPGTLIFAGSLSWYPNRRAMLYFASEVWPVLTREIPNIRFDVIGANPPNELVKLAEFDTRYRLHGFVDDVRPYLKRASIYVCPIDDGGGTRLKLLDAMAMEKAIVAHPIACEGLDMSPGENVMFAVSPREWVDHIKLLFENKIQRCKMGISGRRLVADRYSFRAIGKQLNKVYVDCVQRRVALRHAR